MYIYLATDCHAREIPQKPSPILRHRYFNCTLAEFASKNISAQKHPLGQRKNDIRFSCDEFICAPQILLKLQFIFGAELGMTKFFLWLCIKHRSKQIYLETNQMVYSTVRQFSKTVLQILFLIFIAIRLLTSIEATAIISTGSGSKDLTGLSFAYMLVRSSVPWARQKRQIALVFNSDVKASRCSSLVAITFAHS